ncbi:MAG: class I tRNA ligase family protein, partial [Patescibacteria group bacterium]
LDLPKELFVHGHITVNGRKMSKTIGNIIDPVELVNKYGVDAARYFLLREIPSAEDGDFSYKKFEDRYNGDLANGLGNFSARIVSLAKKYLGKENIEVPNVIVVRAIENAEKIVAQKINEFKLHEALAAVWELIGFGDRYLNEHEPWHTGDKRIIFNAVFLLDRLTEILRPFLPSTAEKLRQSVSVRNNIVEIKKSGILFPRLPRT